jgi:hypothetical protein
MRVIASIFVLLACASAPGGGRAQEAPRLVVERGVGAEPCPDAEALTLRIEQIRGRSGHDLASRYRVAFTRKDDGFSAAISTGPSGANVRTLENSGPRCLDLANAIALTLALLFDSDIVLKKDPDPIVETATPAAPAPQSASPERPRLRRDATLALGAAGLAGVLRHASPAVTADVGIAGARWRMSLGALWAIPQTIGLGPGTVKEQLVSGSLRACFAPLRHEWLRLDVCSGAAVGLLAGQAQGFTRNEHHVRPWVAVPFEIALAGWSAPIGWELGAGGLAAVQRPDFSIEGLGVAYESPQVGGILSFRVVGMLPW